MEAFYEKYVPVIGYGAPSDEVACDDSCFAAYIGDGICDDGGPGSKTSECARGTDCADCGPSHREEAPTPPPSLPALPPGCLLHTLTNLRELEPPRSCPSASLASLRRGAHKASTPKRVLKRTGYCLTT